MNRIVLVAGRPLFVNTASSVSGARVRRLMRRHRVTIREIADRFELTLKRVRDVRRDGGPWDWPLMIAAVASDRREAV